MFQGIAAHKGRLTLIFHLCWAIADAQILLGLAIILTLFFAPLKDDYYSVQTRLGFIQEFCAFYFVGMLQNVAVYPNEKDVVRIEGVEYVLESFRIMQSLTFVFV